jgi:hypothetical protein
MVCVLIACSSLLYFFSQRRRQCSICTKSAGNNWVKNRKGIENGGYPLPGRCAITDDGLYRLSLVEE